MNKSDFITRAIRKLFRYFGAELQVGLEERVSMSAALERLALLSPAIDLIIDVGASNGMWARVAGKSYPESKFLLIEANPVHLESLKKNLRRDPRMSFILKACGESDGMIFFDASDDFGGLAYPEKIHKDMIEVPVVSLDTAVSDFSFSNALIKLDTHGIEMPILRGAVNLLQKTEALIIEAYNFELLDGSLRFFELCAELQKLGFLPVDIVDVMRRPGDLALWQMDLVFLRKNHPVFNSRSYWPD